ncbi:MAG: ABC transporter permease subunit [Gammaproteobacteria bacterium]|nr:ABC transporter permease subunit [Gammaproteobacteria bacterium]
MSNTEPLHSSATIVKVDQDTSRSARVIIRLARPSTERLITAATLLIILGLWYLATHYQWVPGLFVPSPLSVWRALVEMQQTGYQGHTLFEHLASSMYRIVTGLGMALVTAVPLGLLMGVNSKIRAIFDPLIEFYRPLPPLAYYTLLVLWLGIDNTSKIMLLFLAAFPPLCVSAAQAVKGVDPVLIRAARTLGANAIQVFLYIVLPGSLPELFTGLRIAVGVTFSVLVAAEMVAASSGIGWIVLDAGKFLRSDVIFVGIIVMGLTGLLLDKLVRKLEQLATPWRSCG